MIQRGISEHVWNAEELERFDEYLKGANFPRETAAAFRAERGGANQLIEAMMKGWAGRDIWKGGEGFRDLSFLEAPDCDLRAFPLHLRPIRPDSIDFIN